MLGPLKIGAVLLQNGTFIPDSVWAERETFCPGWEAITNLDGDSLDRQIRDATWNFMFVGGALQATSWGSWSGTSVRCAAIRVLEKTRTKSFNAFEITGIYGRRFLGFRYVVVSGHARHVQKSTVLQAITERIYRAPQPSQTSIPDEVTVAPVPAPAVAK